MVLFAHELFISEPKFQVLYSNPHDRDKLHGVSVCLSVCIQMSFRFGEWGLGEGEA